jgi:hypothetical protein
MTDVGEEVDLSPASKTGQLPTLILIVALGMVMKTVFFRLGLWLKSRRDDATPIKAS